MPRGERFYCPKCSEKQLGPLWITTRREKKDWSGLWMCRACYAIVIPADQLWEEKVLVIRQKLDDLRKPPKRSSKR